MPCRTKSYFTHFNANPKLFLEVTVDSFIGVIIIVPSRREIWYWDGVRGSLLVVDICAVLADIMQGGCSLKVLTTGLLRVELAPEEYQLYSEGCGWGEADRTGKSTCWQVSGHRHNSKLLWRRYLLKHCLSSIQRTYSSWTVPWAVKIGVIANRGLRAHVGENAGFGKTKRKQFFLFFLLHTK